MNYLNPEQVEQLQEIGQSLQKQRQDKSISIEQVAAQTFIPMRILKALEAGKAEDLPQPIFIQGFIRRYAKVLGIDGENLAQSLQVVTEPLLAPEPETSPALLPLEISRSLPVYALSLAAASISIIALASGAFYIFNHTPYLFSAVKEKKSVPATKEKKVHPPQPKPAVAQPADPSPQASLLPIQITVDVQAQAWLRVVADGKTEFEGTLDKGDRKTWTAQKQLTVRSGNAGAVLVSFNQGELKPLGAKDDIKEVTFTPLR